MSGRMDEIRERWAKATESPWRAAEQTHGEWYGIHSNCLALGTVFHVEDAEAIAHAPADVAALLQVLEDVKAALTEGRHHPGTRADMAFAALARFDADWLNGREASDG